MLRWGGRALQRTLPWRRRWASPDKGAKLAGVAVFRVDGMGCVPSGVGLGRAHWPPSQAGPWMALILKKRWPFPHVCRRCMESMGSDASKRGTRGLAMMLGARFALERRLAM